MEEEGIRIKIEKVGLIISPEKPYLACSPDNFVSDTSADDSEGPSKKFLLRSYKKVRSYKT